VLTIKPRVYGHLAVGTTTTDRQILDVNGKEGKMHCLNGHHSTMNNTSLYIFPRQQGNMT
jgi:hypothetical protein